MWSPSSPRHPSLRRVLLVSLTPLSALLTLLTLLTLSLPSSALCPEQCRCHQHASDCSSARLSAVPILLDPRIHALRLRDNAIGSVDDTLVFYPSLRELDLSGNRLTSIGEQQLSLQQQLRRLQLANNQLTELKRDALQGLGKLAQLDLSGNLLTELADGVFDASSRLRRLNLAGNRIRAVSREAFLGLGELEALDLSGNELSHVPSDAFRFLGRLHTLRLADNLLTEIPFHAFFVLRSLHNLSLAGNEISRIHAEAFAELHDLKVLDLSFNHLEAFPAPSLAPLKLEELDAGGNRFRSLMPRHLDGLPGLRVVRLCGSEVLTSISGHVFSNNRRLQEVHLCENPRLVWLPRTAVDSMKSLKVLNIGGNGLAVLANMTSLLQRVEVFNISGNPLVCNCSARWLWELPRRLQNASVMSPVMCAGSGRLISSLGEQDLDCGWWRTAAIAAAASLLAAVCAACAAVLLVRHRRRQDRSRSSVMGDAATQEKVLPRLVPAGPGEGGDRGGWGLREGGDPSETGKHSHFTLLNEDYVTDGTALGRGDYDAGYDDECDGDYARVYDRAHMGSYAVKAPSVVV